LMTHFYIHFVSKSIEQEQTVQGVMHCEEGVCGVAGTRGEGRWNGISTLKKKTCIKCAGFFMVHGASIMSWPVFVMLEIQYCG